MKVESLRQLVEWADREAAAAGIDRTPKTAEHIASVIWRHAHGQGLSVGDDWSWVLEMYGPDQMRKIDKASRE